MNDVQFNSINTPNEVRDSIANYIEAEMSFKEKVAGDQTQFVIDATVAFIVDLVRKIDFPN